MKAVFVGHFSSLNPEMKEAISAAGNQVQRQIIKELSLKPGVDSVVSYSMTPLPAWPNGPLLSRSKLEGAVSFIGYVNLPVLKHLLFAFRLFLHLMHFRPQLCLQYNSYLFENFALLMFRMFQPICVLAIFIQDIHIIPHVTFLTKRGLRSIFEIASIKLVKYFDVIIPISESIIDDFRLPRRKCWVFQGGVTDFAKKLMNQPEELPLLNIAVFAGALEPHNGIDRLINQWIYCKIALPLHVFGNGSLINTIKKSAAQADNIVFHNFQPEHVVFEWQCKARWNFCLRYSEGLNQKYFFPSKFFNIACAPGLLLANNFSGIPVSLREHISILADDLSNLPSSLVMNEDYIVRKKAKKRHEIVMKQFSWEACIGKILEMKK